MSERTKRLHTNIEIVVHDKSITKFVLPRKSINELIPADEVFKDIYAKYGRVGAVIRGCRSRDNMTQAKLARLLDISIKHLSEMEYSKRAIDKKMAQKLAKIFGTSYRLFIEAK